MPRILSCIVLVLVTAAATGCDSLFGPKPDSSLMRGLPRALSIEEHAVIHASNSFAFDILRETVRQQPADNVFLSPLSASFALGMTMNGARGTTQDGMRGVLGFGNMELAAVNEAYRALIDLLVRLDRGVDIRIANSIWALQGFPFHEDFYGTARRYFDAEVSTLDFARHDAAATINRWVAQKTGNRIEEIVEAPIPPDVVMYLINAVYFKGDWRVRFQRSLTADAPFRRADGSQATVRMMMHPQTELLHHYDAAAAVDVVELLYGRGAFAMTIVLPAAGVSVDDVIAGLDSEQWRGWLVALQERQLQFAMPRFRLEYETVMNEPLVTLGMGVAFGRAPGTDFRGLSPLGLELFISNVKQKTFVEVNEEGTEAAAATAVEISRTSGPPSVTVDRPFLLAIRERFSGTILFIGKVGDPAR
jgi:serine protease inhibitor